MKLNTHSNSKGARARRSGVAQLRDQAMTIGHDVQDLAATAGGIARRQLDPIEEYVREKPIQSMMVAAGVGALLGLLFFRR
jgi:ElaB/YqjD/DUF883 family membrane-anchored ribosome-binding protein